MKQDMDAVQIELTAYDGTGIDEQFDLDKILYDLDSQISLLSNQADTLDYLVATASGMLCGALDILWVGEFSLTRGRDWASGQAEAFVQKTAKLLNGPDGDLTKAVKFLEDQFPIPSDGNTPTFGGGLQHHLRDFAHHPTFVGLIFSLLTQFTGKSYGTDKEGRFIVADVPDASKAFIGEDIAQKVLWGTIIWFFHLVSDFVGSSSTAGRSGGTGIPGPLLSLAKEVSALPFFQGMCVNEQSLSVFLSKLFNGTLLAKRDENGKIIKDSVLKLDFRGELGAAAEIGRQAIPVIANDCIVRTFYFIRHLAAEMREKNIRSFGAMAQIDWEWVKPMGNATIERMLLIATGVFATLDIGEAVVTQKYLVSVNYVGVGRFAIAIGADVSMSLKKRHIQEIKQMYEDIKYFSFRKEDNQTYQKIGDDMGKNKLGLTLAQTEILYNLEYLKTRHDIQTTKLPVNQDNVKQLKKAWLDEWQDYMANAFASFLQVDGAQLHWYTMSELFQKIQENDPKGIWFRLVLLEAMLFEPYYPLSLEKDKKGNEVPSKKYQTLKMPGCGYNETEGDHYLDGVIAAHYGWNGYIPRLRRCHKDVMRELKETSKTVVRSLAIAGVAVLVTVATAGVFTSQIAVALVGANFAGLHGAALAGACLAYLGGGAVAAGGAGMLGGSVVIVGGGALLGLGAGASGAAYAAGLRGKENTIKQSAKLLVSVREIFLNDEHDIAYSTDIYEQYVQNITEIEKGVVELNLQANVANGEEKKALEAQIKEAKASADVMKIAMKNMNRFISAFEVGTLQ